MKIETIQKMIVYNLNTIYALTAATLITYFLNLHMISIILVVFIVALLIGYFILCLGYWKCPHCHQYLPTKKVGKIKKCPHCDKSIY